MPRVRERDGVDLNAFIYAVNVFLAIWIVFLERRRPHAVFTWILLLIFVPWLGFLLYVIIGRKPSLFKGRSRRKTEEDRRQVREYLLRDDDALFDVGTDIKDSGMEDLRGLVRMLNREGAFFSHGNQVVFFTRGEELFERMFQDIREAKEFVHVEFYIIRDDELGKSFLRLLASKAREGVEVRVVFDDVGSRPAMQDLQDLEGAGGQYARFFPSPVPKVRWINLNINYRNHRKIVVVDGLVSYTGGFNVGDEYLGKGPLGLWRDSHVRIEGPASLALQLQFMLDWNFASKEQLEPSRRYFPLYQGKGDVDIQIVSSGPMRKRDQIKEAYIKMISSAGVSILVQTPYFVPDQSVMDALRIAALSGVDVRIMVPIRRDQLFVHWASDSYLGELLDVGVKVFYYRGGFIHSKTLTVDGKAVSIGSANWDTRGFELNFETNAIIYDREFGATYARAYEEDTLRCTQLSKEEYNQRGVGRKVKESLSRLASEAL